MNLSTSDTQEENEKAELLFSLSDIASPTVVFMHINSLKKEQKLLHWFQSALQQYQHHILDVSSEYVESLFERLLHFKETLGHQLNTLDFVHVIGLENSIMRYEKGVKIMQPLLANMNFERELFFNKLNFSTVLWADSSFFKELNKQAPDFTHWVTRWFEFTAPLENEEIRNKPLVEPKSRGNIPERSQYIQDLLDKFESLNFTANDTTRRIEDQITLLEAIGREYEKQSDYKNSIHYLKRALDLAKKIEATNSIAKLQFYLGTSYLGDRQFEQSLASYLNCLEIFGNENFGSTYHQIGRVYAEQRNWTQALENYQLAIQWKEKSGNDYALGSTYHQIGIVYGEQRNWTLALENYQLAIEWKEKSGNDYELGGTHHQIGIVYAEQRNWTQALENYQLAMQWYEKTGNDYALGSTYHQIGRVYAEQRNWAQALDNYQLAIQWYEKTGNDYELGSTYHQIGMVYAEQRNWKLALDNYQLAMQWDEKAGNDYALGSTCHQIGMIYAKQRNWTQALENYQLAMQWDEKAGNDYELGSTYHQIGRVYEEQRNWLQALDNYQLAIQWKEKTGNDYELGGTYHQIGRVYEQQRNWTQALENYQLAMQWKEKTGNDYELGGTYHQIGRVYEQQRNWTQALDNYQLAMQWYEKTGNDYELGDTCHQIGRVYEEQRDWVQALEFLEKSIENFTLYDHPHLSTAKASRDRVQGKMSQP